MASNIVGRKSWPQVSAILWVVATTLSLGLLAFAVFADSRWAFVWLMVPVASLVPILWHVLIGGAVREQDVNILGARAVACALAASLIAMSAFSGGAQERNSRVRITSPEIGANVGGYVSVTGRAKIFEQEALWIAIRGYRSDRYYLISRRPVLVNDGTWYTDRVKLSSSWTAERRIVIVAAIVNDKSTLPLSLSSSLLSESESRLIAAGPAHARNSVAVFAQPQ